MPRRQALRQPAQAEVQNDPQVEAGEGIHTGEYSRTGVRKSIPPGGEKRVIDGLTRAGEGQSCAPYLIYFLGSERF